MSEYEFVANPASVDPDEGCPAWQRTSPSDEEVMCSPMIVALIDNVAACGWCLQAYERGIPRRI